MLARRTSSYVTAIVMVQAFLGQQVKALDLKASALRATLCCTSSRTRPFPASDLKMRTNAMRRIPAHLPTVSNSVDQRLQAIGNHDAFLLTYGLPFDGVFISDGAGSAARRS